MGTETGRARRDQIGQSEIEGDPAGDDKLLDDTLQQEKETDALLTRLAELSLNQEAAKRPVPLARLQPRKGALPIRSKILPSKVNDWRPGAFQIDRVEAVYD